MVAEILNQTDGHLLPFDFHESLSIHLDFGKWIASSERLSIERSLENWFRVWLDGELRSGGIATISPSDVESYWDGHQKVLAALEQTNPSTVSFLPIDQISVSPCLLLVGAGGGSARSTFIAGVAVGYMVSGPLAGLGIAATLYPNEMRQAIHVAYVDTQTTFASFVNHMNHFRENIRERGFVTSKEITHEAWNLYQPISQIKNGSITVSATLNGQNVASVTISPSEALERLSSLATKAMFK